jgi:hypothetical protein
MKDKTIKQVFNTLLSVMAVIACAQALSASALTLTLASGASTDTLTTSSGLTYVADDLYTFNVTVGSWTVTGTIVGLADGVLDIGGIASSSSGLTKLTITGSDTFTGPKQVTTIDGIAGVGLLGSANGQYILTGESIPLNFPIVAGHSFGGDFPDKTLVTSTISETITFSPLKIPFKVSFDGGVNVVPEGATTVALLGFALIGVEGARRKFRK